jgi:hypothetical protein
MMTACAMGEATPTTYAQSHAPLQTPKYVERDAYLDGVARAFLAELSAGDFDAASRRFGPEGAAAAAVRLRDTWGTWTAACGPLREIQESRIERDSEDTPAQNVATGCTWRLALHFARADAKARMVFDRDEHIVSFQLGQAVSNFAL